MRGAGGCCCPSRPEHFAGCGGALVPDRRLRQQLPAEHHRRRRDEDLLPRAHAWIPHDPRFGGRRSNARSRQPRDLRGRGLWACPRPRPVSPRCAWQSPPRPAAPARSQRWRRSGRAGRAVGSRRSVPGRSGLADRLQRLRLEMALLLRQPRVIVYGAAIVLAYFLSLSLVYVVHQAGGRDGARAPRRFHSR